MPNPIPSRQVKSCWKKPVKGASRFRRDRHARNWLLIDVAREIGVSASKISRIERGLGEVADADAIRDKLRKLYDGCKPPRKVQDPWKGQPFPTGYQVRAAMQAHGLNHSELADIVRDHDNSGSAWLWWSYMNGDIDNQTKRPRALPPGLQKLAAKFVQMTIEELGGVRKPGETLEVFGK